LEALVQQQQAGEHRQQQQQQQQALVQQPWYSSLGTAALVQQPWYSSSKLSQLSQLKLAQSTCSLECFTAFHFQECRSCVSSRTCVC
jgi:hypothetical protein